MVWKLEAGPCHRRPLRPRPEGIQMGSTWTLLTAPLEGKKEGGGEGGGTEIRGDLKIQANTHRCVFYRCITRLAEFLL